MKTEKSTTAVETASKPKARKPAAGKATKAKAKVVHILDRDYKTLNEADKKKFVATKMSKTLSGHRKNYVNSRSHTGKFSQHCGDGLAELLSGTDPVTISRVAEQVRDLKKGELTERYAHLNQGQIRMNSGNLIRGAIKDGFTTVDNVAKLLATA